MEIASGSAQEKVSDSVLEYDGMMMVPSSGWIYVHVMKRCGHLQMRRSFFFFFFLSQFELLRVEQVIDLSYAITWHLNGAIHLLHADSDPWLLFS